MPPPDVRILPRWARRVLDAEGAALEAFAGAARAPDRERVLGAGKRGVVLGTATPGLVVKITRDASEARYLAATAVAGPPQGVVRFAAGVRLGTRVPLWALWREEVHDCGRVLSWRPHRPEHRTPEALDRVRGSRLFLGCLEGFINAALRAKTLLVRAAHAEGRAGLAGAVAGARAWLAEARPPYPARPSYGTLRHGWRRHGGLARLGYCLGACEHIADVIVASGYAPGVGEGLRDALGRGLLLADVHYQNCARLGGPKGPWGIFDVGECVPLRPAWLDAELPVLGEATWPAVPEAGPGDGPLGTVGP